MHSRSAPRRRHDAGLKAKVLAACDEPGASISAVALAHGLNTNLVRNCDWRKGRGLKRAGLLQPPAPAAASSVASGSLVAQRSIPLLPDDARFMPISLDLPAGQPAHAERTVAANAAPASKAESHIHIELRRDPLHVNVRWPTSAATDCAAWLLELTAGPAK